MFEKIPDDCDAIRADEKKIIIYSCPICHEKIELNEENKFKQNCLCGYEWRPSLFGYSATVKIDELVEIGYGIWKDYKKELKR